MENAAVIGWGVVGKATATAFGITKHFDINGDSNISLTEAANCRYVFICLPTPTKEGKCDTTAIRETIKQIEGIRANPLYIIRSTVTPGTARAIMENMMMDRVVSNPEFLTESQWEIDAKRPVMAVIGADNPNYGREVKAIYEGRYKYFEPKLTDTITAEMTKYVFNSFFALKVVFAEEMNDIAQRIGANYTYIRDRLLEHPWGSGHHFYVGHKGEKGYGGKCLPKDVEAFANFSQNKLLQKIQEINNGY